MLALQMLQMLGVLLRLQGGVSRLGAGPVTLGYRSSRDRRRWRSRCGHVGDGRSVIGSLLVSSAGCHGSGLSGERRA